MIICLVSSYANQSVGDHEGGVSVFDPSVCEVVFCPYWQIRVTTVARFKTAFREIKPVGQPKA